MNRLILILLLLSFACKNNNQAVREPVQHNRSTVDMESVNHNKNLNKREEAYILKLITQDSLHHYINSGHGFWYFYKSKKESGQTVKPGDYVVLNYDIKDLSDNTIYSSKEIGEKKYLADHENYFRGFREAVKLLKEGEEAVFIFPSSAAYGYHGDEKKIGSNIPIKVDIKIIKINKQKTE